MKLITNRIVVAPRTLEAMDESVAKWELNASNPRKGKYGGHNCVLCVLFMNRIFAATDGCCASCPISIATGKQFCDTTPYERIPNLLYGQFRGEDDVELNQQVVEELQFIKAVRAICVVE